MMKDLTITIDNILSDTDTFAERFVGLLTLTRGLLMLPNPSPLFPTSVYEFVKLVPQGAWGVLAVLVAIPTLFFAGRRNCLLARIWCAYTMGTHWLMLAILFLLGETLLPSGWFCLAMCLAPLSVIVRLENQRRLEASYAPKG